MKSVILVCVALLSGPATAAAQPDSLLGEAIRLITEGQGDSARALVQRRLAATSEFDTLYPAMLFAAGVVAADTSTALNYFRRVPRGGRGDRL